MLTYTSLRLMSPSGTMTVSEHSSGKRPIFYFYFAFQMQHLVSKVMCITLTKMLDQSEFVLNSLMVAFREQSSLTTKRLMALR